MESDFVSIKEFAAKLGVHHNTIRRAIKNGRISALRVGAGARSHYRIAVTELNRMAIVDLETIIEGIIEKRKLLDK